MARMYVEISPDENKALIEYANEEVRPLREQVRWIVRQELIRTGYLKPEPQCEETGTNHHFVDGQCTECGYGLKGVK
jgi:hypothetical protein